MTSRITDTASTSPHFRRIGRAELAAMWADPDLTRTDIARRVGLSDAGLTRRIKAMGLPLRGSGSTKRPSIHPRDEPLFCALWRAGVGGAEIAARFGTCYRTVANTSRRLSLPARNPGTRPSMTAAQFFMRITARAEQAAFINAEMADGCGVAGKLVGQKHARAA